jgi:hypothetical protein
MRSDFTIDRSERGMSDVGSEIFWRRPARCLSEAACVEVGFVGDVVLIRNSTGPDGPYVACSREEWEHFLAGAKADEFDN